MSHRTLSFDRLRLPNLRSQLLCIVVLLGWALRCCYPYFFVMLDELLAYLIILQRAFSFLSPLERFRAISALKIAWHTFSLDPRNYECEEVDFTSTCPSLRQWLHIRTIFCNRTTWILRPQHCLHTYDFAIPQLVCFQFVASRLSFRNAFMARVPQVKLISKDILPIGPRAILELRWSCMLDCIWIGITTAQRHDEAYMGMMGVTCSSSLFETVSLKICFASGCITQLRWHSNGRSILQETLTSPIALDRAEGSFRLRLGIRQRWQFSDAFVDGLLLASYPMPHSVTSLPNGDSKFRVFLDWVSYDGGDVEFASVAEAFSPELTMDF